MQFQLCFKQIMQDGNFVETNVSHELFEQRARKVVSRLKTFGSQNLDPELFLPVFRKLVLIDCLKKRRC